MFRQEAILLCLCKTCPTFVDCQELIAYCLAQTGKSVCIKTEKTCDCPSCPVQKTLLFRNQFFCTRGNERELEAL